MTLRMLSRLPQDRRTALLCRIRGRLREIEALDRSLEHLGESIDPDEVLADIVAILDEACRTSRRKASAA